MVRAKKYETASTFVEIIRKKTIGFFPDTVYVILSTSYQLFNTRASGTSDKLYMLQ